MMNHSIHPNAILCGKKPSWRQGIIWKAVSRHPQGLVIFWKVLEWLDFVHVSLLLMLEHLYIRFSGLISIPPYQRLLHQDGFTSFFCVWLNSWDHSWTLLLKLARMKQREIWGFAITKKIHQPSISIFNNLPLPILWQIHTNLQARIHKSETTMWVAGKVPQENQTQTLPKSLTTLRILSEATYRKSEHVTFAQSSKEGQDHLQWLFSVADVLQKLGSMAIGSALF